MMDVRLDSPGKNGRKCSGCQLFPKPLWDKDETGKGGKLYLLWTSYNSPKLRSKMVE